MKDCNVLPTTVVNIIRLLVLVWRYFRFGPTTKGLLSLVVCGIFAFSFVAILSLVTLRILSIALFLSLASKRSNRVAEGGFGRILVADFRIRLIGNGAGVRKI